MNPINPGVKSWNGAQTLRKTSRGSSGTADGPSSSKSGELKTTGLPGL